MIHPSDEILIGLAGALPGNGHASTEWRVHVQGCPRCQSRITEFADWDAAIAASKADGIPPRAAQFLNRLITPIPPIRLIPLHLLETPAAREPVRLAADGQTAPPAGLQHRATLYSEDPEMVLRVMRDPGTGADILHLLGSAAVHPENVLLEIEEPKMEFVTDSEGRVEVPGNRLPDPGGLKWRVRLPDATFLLHPLPDDLPREQEGPESELEAGDHSRIAVALTRTNEGLNLRVRLLRIEGREQFDLVRLVISQKGGMAQVIESNAADPAVIRGLSPDHWINIRIFAMP